MTQEHARELLTCPASRVQEILSSAHEIAQCLKPFVRNRDPDHRAHAQLPRQVARVVFVRLDPGPRHERDLVGSDDDAGNAMR